MDMLLTCGDANDYERRLATYRSPHDGALSSNLRPDSVEDTCRDELRNESSHLELTTLASLRLGP